MTTFEYRGFSSTGRSVRGLVEAPDAKRARALLAARGVAVEALAPASAAAPSGTRAMRLPPAPRAAAYRELAALLESGVPLVPALEVLLEAPLPVPHRLALAALRDGVREGAPFSAVLARLPLRASPLEFAVLQVGERTGTLAQSFARLADSLGESIALRDRTFSALLYPAVVVVVALLLGSGVSLFLLPRVQRLLDSAALPVPALSRFLFGSGRFLGAAVLVAMAIGALALRAAVRRARRDPELAVRLDRRLLGVPLLGAAHRELAALRFLRVLALLLERGVALVEALPLAARASSSPLLASEIDRETDLLARGKPLSDVFRDAAPLPPSLSSWVRAGQSGGDLPGLLLHAADAIRQAFDRRSSRALTLVETALTLAVGLFVALLALAVLLPVLHMNHALPS